MGLSVTQVTDIWFIDPLWDSLVSHVMSDSVQHTEPSRFVLCISFDLNESGDEEILFGEPFQEIEEPCWVLGMLKEIEEMDLEEDCNLLTQ